MPRHDDSDMPMRTGVTKGAVVEHGEARKDGTAPAPRISSGVEIWCRLELDLMFSELSVRQLTTTPHTRWDGDVR